MIKKKKSYKRKRHSRGNRKMTLFKVQTYEIYAQNMQVARKVEHLNK